MRPKRKPGSKYAHPGTTRNGFGLVDRHIELTLEACPACGSFELTQTEAPCASIKLLSWSSVPWKPTNISALTTAALSVAGEGMPL